MSLYLSSLGLAVRKVYSGKWFGHSSIVTAQILFRDVTSVSFSLLLMAVFL